MEFGRGIWGSHDGFLLLALESYQRSGPMT
jgi:hypothetical protein